MQGLPLAILSRNQFLAFNQESIVWLKYLLKKNLCIPPSRSSILVRNIANRALLSAMVSPYSERGQLGYSVACIAIPPDTMMIMNILNHVMKSYRTQKKFFFYIYTFFLKRIFIYIHTSTRDCNFTKLKKITWNCNSSICANKESTFLYDLFLNLNFRGFTILLMLINMGPSTGLMGK